MKLDLGDTVRRANRKDEGPVIGTMTTQANTPGAPLRRSVCVMWTDGPEWHAVGELVLVAKKKR